MFSVSHFLVVNKEMYIFTRVVCFMVLSSLACFKIVLAFAAASILGFLSLTCDVVPTFHGFVRAASFLHALTIISSFPSICTTFEIVLHCFLEMMVRILVFCTYLECSVLSDLLSCFCHCKPLERITTCASVSFNAVAQNSSRFEPHVQKDFPFALCILCTFRTASSRRFQRVR